MMNLSCSATAAAASTIAQAAQLLLSDLERGKRIDATGILRSAMVLERYPVERIGEREAV